MESVLCDLCKWSEKSATNSRNSSHILLFIPCECVKWSERREKNRTIHWLFHTKWGTSIVHLLSPENWETTKPLYLCRTNLIGTQWKMLTCNVNDVSITIWLRAWQKQKQRTRCRIIMAIIIITRLTRAHTACVCVCEARLLAVATECERCSVPDAEECMHSLNLIAWNYRIITSFTSKVSLINQIGYVQSCAQ